MNEGNNLNSSYYPCIYTSIIIDIKSGILLIEWVTVAVGNEDLWMPQLVSDSENFVSSFCKLLVKLIM